MTHRRHLEFKKFPIFGHVTVTGFNIWCSVPNFIKIGWFCTVIWRFNDFQNGSRPPSWILHICIFCPVTLVSMPFCFLVQNFAEIGQSVDEMAKKAIFKMAAAAILNLKKFNFWSRDCHWFNICCIVANFIKIGLFFTAIWWFSDLQNGGRPPSWICYDVTILQCRTHFRCANIVLKFHVDRCCSFTDTCNIIRHPFGCT